MPVDFYGNAHGCIHLGRVLDREHCIYDFIHIFSEFHLYYTKCCLLLWPYSLLFGIKIVGKLGQLLQEGIQGRPWSI